MAVVAVVAIVSLLRTCVSSNEVSSYIQYIVPPSDIDVRTSRSLYKHIDAYKTYISIGVYNFIPLRVSTHVYDHA